MKRVIIAASIIAFFTLIISCARDVSEDISQAYDRVLASWVKTNYGKDVAPTDSGVYILNFNPGKGVQVRDCAYVFVHYVTKDLSGNIISTNREDVSRQLGIYSPKDYYGSDIWFVGAESIATGLEQVLRTMKVGGTATIAVPARLTTVAYSGYNAFSKASVGNTVYEVEVDTLVDDIFEYQDECMKEYSRKYYGGMDTTMAAFYYKHLSETAGCDSIQDETTIKVRYVGKRLDGTVFDTNIEDTAKFYRIYSDSNDYDALEIKYYKDLSTFIEEAQMVKGFTYALSRMKYGDAAATFFRSEYGYSSTGQGSAIPEYCPLFFYIYIEPRDN